MSDPDHLTAAEAEAMARAMDPESWDTCDRAGSERNEYFASRRRVQTAIARRAWAARPATARKLDVEIMIWSRKDVSGRYLEGVAEARARHLTGDSNG